MRTKRLVILGAVALIASCASSKKESKEEPSVVPQNFAPATEESPEQQGSTEERADDDAVAADVSDTAPGDGAICQTDNCQAACGSYQGEQLAACYDAWKASCFTSEPEETYDCGPFGRDAEAGDGAAEEEAPTPKRSLKKRKAKESGAETQAKPEMMGDPTKTEPETP